MKTKILTGNEPTEKPVVTQSADQAFPKAAIQWYEFGLPVIPVRPKTKQTAVKWDQWLEDLSPEAIKAYWQQHPDHELGFIVGPDLVVFDADNEKAVTALNQLMRSFDILCNHIVSTSRGEHYYFRLAPGAVVSTDTHNTQQHPERLDIKTGRSMIILPPSTGKAVSLSEAETTGDLVEVGQDFVDAVYRHNGREAPTASVQREPVTFKRGVVGELTDEITKLLGVIDPDCGYTDWLAAGMAIHHAFQGSDEGLALWHDWSSRGDKYEGYVPVRKKWDSFDGHTGIPVTVSTLYKLAVDAGADLDTLFEEFFDVIEDIPGIADVAAQIDTLTQTDEVEEEEHDLVQFSLRGMSAAFEAEMQEQVLILGQIAILGQSTAIYGPPNAGKTLLVLHELIQGIQKGVIKPEHLFYINADDNQHGLTHKLKLAEQHCFEMLAPGHLEFRAKDFLKYLRRLGNKGKARETIVVLDTLKKFVDLMDKRAASDFSNTIREFVSKGGTVIALAHVNKKRDADGKPIYAGTSDIVDDADCAYVMDTISDDKDIRTVEFENIKSRGKVTKRATYQYSMREGLEYEALMASVVAVDDTKADALRQVAKQQHDSDLPLIEAITNCIAEGITSKTKIVKAAASETGLSQRHATRILEKFTGSDPSLHKWDFTMAARGAKVFELLIQLDDIPDDDDLTDIEELPN